MTLSEFLAPLTKGKRKDQILAILYYACSISGSDGLSLAEIKDRLRLAKIPGYGRINVSDVLTKSGHYVQEEEDPNKVKKWSLTDSGKIYVRDELNVPVDGFDVKEDLIGLSDILSGLTENDVKGYVEEAVKCINAGALRASVVFLWAGAIRVIQTNLLGHEIDDLDAAIKKHDPKARRVSKIDHFSYIKDSTVILAFLDLGHIDKSEKDTLQEALGLRNRCGHPGKYQPGQKKVSSFIEDLVSIVFKG